MRRRPLDSTSVVGVPARRAPRDHTAGREATTAFLPAPPLVDRRLPRGPAWPRSPMKSPRTPGRGSSRGHRTGGRDWTALSWWTGGCIRHPEHATNAHHICGRGGSNRSQEHECICRNSQLTIARILNIKFQLLQSNLCNFYYLRFCRCSWSRELLLFHLKACIKLDAKFNRFVFGV